MFYYLLYNSSFEFITNNRLFSTILYGSIAYIITHAILNYCSIEILGIIKNYFWIILFLDIISCIWSLYQLLSNPVGSNPLASNYPESSNNLDTNTGNDINVSFNLLKNKINTLFDRSKSNLTIAPPQQSIITNNPTNTNIPPNPPITTSARNNSPPRVSNSNTLSTPISQIRQNAQTGDLGSSTPITLLREKINIPDVGNYVKEPGMDPEGNESIAGSDVASVMDLDDFEKSL